MREPNPRKDHLRVVVDPLFGDFGGGFFGLFVYHIVFEDGTLIVKTVTMIQIIV